MWNKILMFYWQIGYFRFENVPGEFKCICDDGYVRDKSKKNCTGKISEACPADGLKGI
jgi:hypothetical protein